MATDPHIVKPGSKLIPDGMSANDEIVSRRTIRSKTFDMGSGKRRVSVSPRPVHFRDDPVDDQEPWKDIDLTIEPISGSITLGMYGVTILKDGVGYSYQSNISGRVDVELIEIDGKNVNYNKMLVIFDGNEIFWYDVAKNLELSIFCGVGRVEIWKKLLNSQAPTKFKWRVRQWPGTCEFNAKSDGWDSTDGTRCRVEMINTVEPGTPTAEYDEFFYTEEWTGRVGRIVNPTTRVKDWDLNPVYPVTIDASTGDIHITNAVDDGYVNYQGNWNQNSIYCGKWTGIDADEGDAGFRFRSVGVPTGVTITSATLKMYKSGQANSPTFKLYMDKVANAASFSNNNIPDDFATKIGANTWAPAGGDAWKTFNITSTVQSVIDLTGWTSANNMRFGLFGDDTLTGIQNINVSVYNANEAILTIDYEEAGGEEITLTKTALALTGKVLLPEEEHILTKEALTLTGKAVGTAHVFNLVKTALGLTGKSFSTNVTFLFVKKALVLTGKTFTASTGEILTLTKTALTFTGKALHANMLYVLTKTALTLTGKSVATAMDVILTFTKTALTFTGKTLYMAEIFNFVKGTLLFGGKALGAAVAGAVIKGGLMRMGSRSTMD